MHRHRDALHRGVFSSDIKWLAGALFVSAMIALIGGLGCFLREVYVTTHTVRIMSAKFRP